MFADERFKSLNQWFCSNLLQPALLFQSAAISAFTNLNHGEPSIHLPKQCMESLDRNFAKRIIRIIKSHV